MTPAASSASIEVHATHGIVVVKRSTDPSGLERLSGEATVLDAARHPGVVDLVERRGDDGDPVVMTRWVGPASLAATGRLPTDQVAAAVAALSETVADLHELGIVHGNLRSEHVLLATDGRPVVCGFGGATFVARRSHGSSAPADDVRALGHLLRGLVGDVEPEPIPDRKRWWRRPRWTGFQGRALLTLADQTTDGGHPSVLTARALAAAIHDIVPDARFGPTAVEPPSGQLVAPPDPVPPDPEPAPAHTAPASPRERPAPVPTAAAPPVVRAVDHDLPELTRAITPHGPMPSVEPRRPAPTLRTRHRRAMLLVAVVAALAAVLVGGPRLRHHPTAGHAQRSTRSTAVPAVTAPSVSEPKSPAPNVDRACGKVVGVAADVDGNGCPDPVQVHGVDVVAAGTHFRIGRAGDAVLVGDWDCDGRATPAALRPSTGEVFVFPRWATPGQPLTVHAVTAVAGATAVSTDRDGRGCSRLAVRSGSGHDVVVDTRSGR